jgi:hypothetical protein
MSSNTLRGVGQEGDGGGSEGEQPPGPDDPKPAAPESIAASGAPSGAAERMPELRKIRSLDSTVPGTRSLDASVPEAQPSLDAKVPSLAVTMMGMTANSIPGRDGARAGAPNRPKDGDGSARDGAARVPGTVQGRDVHLPVEMQRRAGVISVPGMVPPAHLEAAPASVDYSEPTIAEPARVDHAGPNVISHGPWYEQEPLGSGDYDDPRPSLIGRVAIGAAVAASLAVVLFAIVRVRAQGAAQEAESTQALSPQPAATPAPAPTPTTIPEEQTAKAADPVIDWGDPVPGPSARAAGAEGATRTANTTANTTANGARPPQQQAVSPAPTRSTPDTSGHASRPITAGTPKKFSTNGASPLPPNLFRPKALGEPEPTRPPRAEGSAATSFPTVPPPVDLTSPGALSGPGSSSSAASAGTSSDDRGTGDPSAKGTAKARPKKTDDPDSTLPLNLD